MQEALLLRVGTQGGHSGITSGCRLASSNRQDTATPGTLTVNGFAAEAGSADRRFCGPRLFLAIFVAVPYPIAVSKLRPVPSGRGLRRAFLSDRYFFIVVRLLPAGNGAVRQPTDCAAVLPKPARRSLEAWAGEPQRGEKTKPRLKVR